MISYLPHYYRAIRIHSCHKYRRYPGWRGPCHRKADVSASVFSRHMTHVSLPEDGAGEVRHGQPDGWSDRRGRQNSCRRPRERRSGQRRADYLQTSGVHKSPVRALASLWVGPGPGSSRLGMTLSTLLNLLPNLAYSYIHQLIFIDNAI